jgi:predicted Zn-dependent protease with MMP-like domain
MKVSRSQFEQIVGEALDGVPEEFSEVLENVNLSVEEEPSEEDLRALGLDPDRDTLFGLYQGVALPDRGLDYQSLPDRIVIYRRPILDACESREEVVGEVRQTVLHELGHYFGIGEEDMPEEVV